MCVCFIATLESLQHVSAYMGHLQVIFLQIPEYQVFRQNYFYKYRNIKFLDKTISTNTGISSF
jgi:hypothetical protein